MPTPPPDPRAGTAARDRAAKIRAQWLLDASRGEKNPRDLPWEACQEGGEALLKLRLRAVVAALPGMGGRAAERVERHLAETLGGTDHRAWLTARNNNPKWDVGWLVDARAGGKRVVAWLDAWRPRTPPWDGFPHTPMPPPGRGAA